MRFIAFTLFLVLRFAAVSQGSELIWSRIHPSVDRMGYAAITSSSQGLVAIGVSFELFFSKEGEDWIRCTVPGRERWRGIAGSDEGFVAVGDGGAIAISRHGYVWEKVASGVTADLRSVVWTGNSFIACGGGGRILRSLDGRTWQNKILNGAANFQNVFLADGEVYVIGDSTLASSADDGLGWMIRDLGAQAGLKIGCRGRNGPLLYSEKSGIKQFFQKNGLGEWVSRAIPGPRALTGLGFDEEKGFLAVSDYGTLWFSADGQDWTFPAETLSGPGAITAIEDGWIVAGVHGEILRVGRGRGWNVPVILQAAAHAVARHAGRYYVFGHYGWIHSSVDGVNWSSSLGNSSADVLRSCVGFHDQLIVIGGRGAVRRIKSGGEVEFGYVGRLVDLRAIASSGSRLVAVGMGGVISRSDDGQTWTAVSSPVTEDLHAVTYANERFYAVGENGVLIESLDGSSWEVGAVGTDADLFGIVATDNGLVAVGGEGGIFRKPTGGGWMREVSGTTFDLRAVIRTDAEVVVCGDSGTLLTTTGNGVWTSLHTESPGGCDFRAALAANGRLLLVGSSGFYEESIPSSAISKGWVIMESTGGGIDVMRRPYSGLEAVVAVPDGFLAAGWNGRTLLSLDGKHWSEGEFPGKWTIRDLAVADGLILAGGEQGIMISTEGRTWTPATYEKHQLVPSIHVEPSKQVRRIVRGRSDWMAVGFSGTVLRSLDGLTWHRPTDPGKSLGEGTFTGVAYGAGRWVISGGMGEVWVSSNGEEWFSVQTPTTREILDVCYYKGKFLASISDAADVMLESTDGISWVLSPGIAGWRAGVLRLADSRCFGLGLKERIASTGDGSSWISHCEGTKLYTDSDSNRTEIRGIAFKDGIYVAVGTKGMISRSTNLDSWTHVLGGDVQGFRRVFRLRDRFVAITDSGNLLTSVDGRRWTNHWARNYPNEILVAAVDNGARAVVVGKTVLVSDDLDFWVETAVPTGKEFTSVAWNGTQFIAGSSDGGIYHSHDGISWNLEFTTGDRINDVAGIDGLGLALSGSNVSSWTSGGPWSQASNTWGSGEYRFLYADSNRLMVTGGANFALWSDNGQNWEKLFYSSPYPRRISKGIRKLYSLSQSSELLGSPDGRQWSSFPVVLPERGVDVIEHEGVLFTFHEKGEIMLGMSLISPSFQTEMIARGHATHIDFSPSGDANDDGIPNMLAHYFGLSVVSPNREEIGGLPKLEIARLEGDMISIIIPTPDHPASYLRLSIEAGENLENWEEVAVRIGSGSWATLGDATLSTHLGGVTLTLPSHHGSRFFRMKVQEQP